METLTASQCTSGPWGFLGDGVLRKAAYREAAPGITIASPHNTEPICRVSGYAQPLEANARLIAMAPELELFAVKVGRSACLDQRTGDKCYCFACEARRILSQE